MVRNGNFSEGWIDLPPAPGFLINQQPLGWTLQWLEPGESLYDDPEHQAYGVPKCRHLASNQLPEDEQPDQPNALILAGDTTFNISHAGAAFGATLSQTVTGLAPNSVATLTVPIQVHLHADPDAYGAESGVWVNGKGGWVHGHLMGDRRWHFHVINFLVPANGQAEVIVRVKSKWPRPKDFFIDHITLDVMDHEPGTVPGTDPPPYDNPRPGVTQEISRQAVSLGNARPGDILRLHLSTRMADHWLLQRRLKEPLQGETLLEVILNRPVGSENISEARPAVVPINEEEPHSGQRVLGMDVSYAQGLTIDFEKAAEMGVRFCFIRAGSGKTEKDANFEHQFREAGRAGMLRGIYYYLYPESAASVSDPTLEGQARRFVSLLKPEAELGAIVDIEDKRLTPADVQRFVTEFQKHEPFNRPIMIYTGAWFWNAARGFSGDVVAWTANHPLWVAHYPSATKPTIPSSSFKIAIPKPWKQYTFHQWTSVGGALAGQDREALDLNYFPGSLTELLGWAGSEKPVIIGIKFVTATAGLHVRSGPSTSHDILTTLVWGHSVNVLEEGPWDKIEVDGITGYASSEYLSTENPLTTISPPETFNFEVWPTTVKQILLRFGDEPEYYRDLSSGLLPGHDGMDIIAPFGSPYFAVAPGRVVQVSDRQDDGTASPYGWHILIAHKDGYSTLYGHAAPNIHVRVGQEVTAGHLLAYSGNTGESSGPHLHLSLYKEGHQLPGWPAGVMDPWPFLDPLYNDISPPMGNLSEGYLPDHVLDIRPHQLALTKSAVPLQQAPNHNSERLGQIPAGCAVRLLSAEKVSGYYLCETSMDMAMLPTEVRTQHHPPQVDLLPFIQGDGRQVILQDSSGNQKTGRTEAAGLSFFQVNNNQWTKFSYDNDFIYCEIDTTTSAETYVRLSDPDRQQGSRWLRRRMAVGETYTQTRQMRQYRKTDGTILAGEANTVTDTFKLVGHTLYYTTRAGREIHNVIEIHRVISPQDPTPLEKLYFAHGLGLVGRQLVETENHPLYWLAVTEIHGPESPEILPRERVVMR